VSKEINRVPYKVIRGENNTPRVEIGDRKYNLTGTSSPKLLLCAFRLSFRHPVTGKKMEFILPVPEEYPLSSGKVL
jgi:hypothetical protein